MGSVVRAAGGVIARDSEGGTELLLVHRPRYDDWTFPKGKVDAGESDEQCALREVEEETGLRCELLNELSSISYIDRRGRHKVVRYWAMRPVAGKFLPNDEVDEAKWVAPKQAAKLLSYEHDRAMLKEIGHLGHPMDRVFLLRHASAGKREEYSGDDRQRPLDAKGLAHARGLVELLSGFPVGRIIASPYLRCVETVAPLAEALGVALEVREELAEGSKSDKVNSLLSDIEDGSPVLCTHGDVIFSLVGRERPAKKGSVWILERKDPAGGYVPTGYLPPPSLGGKQVRS